MAVNTAGYAFPILRGALPLLEVCVSSPSPPSWALSILRDVAEGLYGKGNVLLTGEQADKVRAAYYAYWAALGQPDSEVHRCMATALYSAETIRIEFVQPTVAVLVGEVGFIDPVDNIHTSGSGHFEFLSKEFGLAPAGDSNDD